MAIIVAEARITGRSKNQWARVYEKTRYSLSLKLSPHPQKKNYYFQKKKGKFVVGKTDRLHLNQMFKLNITRNWIYLFCDVLRSHLISGLFLPKKRNLHFTVKKHQTDLNWETFCKLTGEHSSKMSRSWSETKSLFQRSSPNQMQCMILDLILN